MNKVIYISYDGMTDPLGQSQVLPYVKGLSQKGYQFSIISFEKHNLFEQKKSLIQNLCDESNIKWIPLKYTKKPPLVSTFWDLFRLYFLLKKIVKKEEIKFIHCRSYLTTLVAYYLKKRFKTKYLFDMRGFWVDERVEGNIWNIKNPVFKLIYKFLKNKETKLFSNADYCISLTEAGKNVITSWDLDRKIDLEVQVIPCCVDLNLFDYNNIDEVTKDKWLKKFDFNSDDYIFCYLGNLSTVYRFDVVLDAIIKLNNKNANVKLLVITHEDQEIVNKFLNDKDILNNDFIKITSLERNEVPFVLSICAYSIAFYVATPSRKGTSPTKLAEMFACGLKTISNSGVGDTKEIILNNKVGYIIEDFTENSLNTLVDNFEFEKNYNKREVREVAKKYYDLKDGIEKYAKVYEKIINE